MLPSRDEILFLSALPLAALYQGLAGSGGESPPDPTIAASESATWTRCRGWPRWWGIARVRSAASGQSNRGRNGAWIAIELVPEEGVEPSRGLSLVTKESIEERILRLHDTKRGVLANIWDKGNQDVIAAPGGSGAFREMVAALLRTQGPPGAAAGTASVATMEAAGDAGQPPPSDEAEDNGAPAPPPVAAADSADFAAGVSGTPGAAAGAGLMSGSVRVGSSAAVDRAMVPLGAPAAVIPAAAAATAVDPAALSAAIAAIAPTIAPDHRKSLAVVLRVLAEALEAP